MSKLQLTHEQERVLLEHPDDWVSVNACDVIRGETSQFQRKSMQTDFRAGTSSLKNEELRIYQEFIFRCRDTDWNPAQRFMRNSNEQLGLEQVGSQALCAFYVCKSLNSSWLLGAVGMQNGFVWVDNKYECYSGMRHLKRNKFLRAVLDNPKGVATDQQRRAISILVPDLASTRGDYARFFVSGTGQSAPDDGLL